MRVSVWIYRSTWWMIVGMKSIILRLEAPFVLFTCWNACNYVLASFQKVCIKSKQKFQLCNPIADCKSNLRDLRNFHASIPISHTIETPKVFCNHLTPETVQFRLAKLKHLTGNWLHWGTISIHHHPQTFSFPYRSDWTAFLAQHIKAFMKKAGVISSVGTINIFILPLRFSISHTFGRLQVINNILTNYITS